MNASLISAFTGDEDVLAKAAKVGVKDRDQIMRPPRFEMALARCQASNRLDERSQSYSQTSSSGFTHSDGIWICDRAC